MAQTNFTPISLYYSTTAAAVPTAGNLVAGELAINTNDGKLFYKDSAGVVQTLATKDTAAGTFTSITDSGNLTFTGTGNRIRGDFSTTTFSNRVLFQSSTTNGITNIGVIPNGTGTTGGFRAYNNSDPTNASHISVQADGTVAAVLSGITGTGTYLPLTMYTGGSERLRIDTSGNVLIGTTSGTAQLTVANDASISGQTIGGNTTLGNTYFGVSVPSSATGGNNTSVGYQTLSSNTSGAANSAFGQQALRFNTTASNSTALGFQAAYANTTGYQLVALGQAALYANTTGAANTAVGVNSLTANTTGNSNTAVGLASLSTNSTGGSNVAVGQQALNSNTTASNNTAVGYQAGYSNTTGTTFVAIGERALFTSNANNNVAVGSAAMYYTTSGTENVAVGKNVLISNTTGSYNVALGMQALNSNTSASNNTAVGYQAGYSNTTAGGNVFLGYQSGYTSTGIANTIVGVQAGYSLTTGTYNAFFGQGASGGSGSAITTGTKNTIIGGYTGNQGGLDIRTANNYIVLSDGDGNPRGIFDTNGSLLVGTTASSYSPTNGVQLLNLSSGTLGVVSIGHATGTASSSYYASFGYAGGVIGSISQNGTTAVAYNTSSDYRLKENISPMTGALDVVQQLKPVTYTWKADGSDGQGFIAHELAEICPESVSGEKDAVDAEGKPVYQGIDTSFLVATLTAAIQELKAEFDAYKATHP